MLPAQSKTFYSTQPMPFTHGGFNPHISRPYNLYPPGFVYRPYKSPGPSPVPKDQEDTVGKKRLKLVKVTKKTSRK